MLAAPFSLYPSLLFTEPRVREDENIGQVSSLPPLDLSSETLSDHSPTPMKAREAAGNTALDKSPEELQVTPGELASTVKDEEFIDA